MRRAVVQLRGPYARPVPLPLRPVSLLCAWQLQALMPVHRLCLVAGGDLNMSDPFPSPIRVMSSGVAAVSIGGNDTCIILLNQTGAVCS